MSAIARRLAQNVSSNPYIAQLFVVAITFVGAIVTSVPSSGGPGG